MQTDAKDRERSKGQHIGFQCVKAANKTIQILIDLVFILVLLLGIYYLADTIYTFYHSRTEAVMPAKPDGDDVAALKKLSKDCVAWITIDNTSIDYPVMQGVDNYEYLNKDPYGDYSLAGSIFLDSRNRKDFSDSYSLLYGHHVSGKKMFGALDDFEKPSFFESHTDGWILTSRGLFPLKVLAFLYTQANNDLVFDPDLKGEGLADWIRSNAENYNEKAEGGPIVALSTCKSPTSTRRMIVFVTIDESKKIKTK